MSAPKSLPRQLAAELFGTMFLVATIIGSGMMGDNLSPDDGVALLGNTLATWGILYVLITALGPISGAHFNPVVSATAFLKREFSFLKFALFCCAQGGGGVVGAYVAHGMFMKRNGEFDGKDRDTDGEFFAEFVATVGLLSCIFGFVAAKADVGMGVGLYITAGYWYTSSTSFANPAVTIARSFTDTFASIAPKSFQAYFLGQLLGLVFALPATEWLFADRTPLEALATLVRMGPPPVAGTKAEPAVVSSNDRALDDVPQKRPDHEDDDPDV
mmetsp:Transcript_9290/g.28462  ORF Transcript_9290/g.28462 Transcript_9290/m.28462 type:complete len:272 (-) Transcript_9290:252-1067(-)